MKQSRKNSNDQFSIDREDTKEQQKSHIINTNEYQQSHNAEQHTDTLEALITIPEVLLEAKASIDTQKYSIEIRKDNTESTRMNLTVNCGQKDYKKFAVTTSQGNKIQSYIISLGYRPTKPAKDTYTNQTIQYFLPKTQLEALHDWLE